MKTMRAWHRNSIIILLMTFSLLSGCRKPDSSKAQAKPGLPGKMGAPQIDREKSVSVMVYTTQPDTINRYLRLTGGLEAGNETLVYSQSTEQIEKITVNVGEKVKANQVLAVQSGRSFQESVKQAEAALQSAIAQEELAKQNHARNTQLFEERIISKQSFDQTATGVKTAALSVEQTQAQLALAREQQGDTIVKAPFAGKVAQMFFHEGDMVNSGVAVFKIVNTETFKAILDVPETDAAYVSLGQHVLAVFPAIPDVEFPGLITRIDEAIDPDKRALEIEVSFTNPAAETEEAVHSETEGNSSSSSHADAPQSDQSVPAEHGEMLQKGFASLRSGQFGQFKLEIEHHEDVVVIPDNAIMTQTEVSVNERGEQVAFKTYSVYVIEQGKAVKKTVTPGIYSSGRVELTSGVNFGEAVVVTGQNVVKPGDTVNVLNQQQQARAE